MNTEAPFFSPILMAVLSLSTSFLIQANREVAEAGQFNQDENYLSSHRFKIKQLSSSTRQYSQSSQCQRTTIDLDASELGQPHILDISAAPGAQLTGPGDGRWDCDP